MTDSRIENDAVDDLSGLWREPPNEGQEVRPLEVVLERRQHRNALRFWTTLVGEVVVTLAGAWYALRLIAAGPGDSVGPIQGVALLALLTVTTALAVVSRRGQWQALDGSPGEAAALELRRARGRQLGCRIGWGVLVGVAGFVFWSLRTSGVELLSLRFAVLLLAILGYVVVLTVLGRRAERETRQSRELLHQLSEIDTSSGR